MNLLILIEKIINKIRIKAKIFYWRLKYGKKIKLGKKLNFRKRFNILIENNGYLEIGDNNFFNNDCSINCLNKVTIGNDNIFGENVKIYDHDHIFNQSKEELKSKFKTSNIQIGNENWIGSNVVILRKTKMDDRNVVSAGTILNKRISCCKLIKSERNYYCEDISIKDNEERK